MDEMLLGFSWVSSDLQAGQLVDDVAVFTPERQLVCDEGAVVPCATFPR